MSGYPGAKAAAGVYQTIINEMPPHQVYCEPFVGGGHILRTKRPAEASIVIDADADVAAHWHHARASFTMYVGPLEVHQGDATCSLARFGERIHAGWLIYADPPYVRSARRSAAPIYRCEMTDGEHRVLIALLRSLPAMVLISGYGCALYDELLGDWRRIDYNVMTHAGLARESLWCNFPEPAERHEYTFIGRNFRERERIKRKKARWCRRIASMPEAERNALLQALLEHRQIGRGRPPPAASSELASGAGVNHGDRLSPEMARGAPEPDEAAIALAFELELERARRRLSGRSRIAGTGGEDLNREEGRALPITGGGALPGRRSPTTKTATAPPMARDPCPPS